MDIVSFNGFRDPTKYTTKNKKFEDSLYDYLLIATKLVQKLCTKDVCVEILYDEDALSNMAHSLMMADWRWDGKYISKNKRTKTQYSYRSQCIIYEIKKHLRRKQRVYSQKFKQSLNYTSVDETQPLYCKIVDRSSLGVNPIEIAIQKEKFETFKKILTHKEYICVTMYYIDMYTYKEIGQKLDLSQERIRQIVSLEALPKLRRHYEDKNE